MLLMLERRLVTTFTSPHITATMVSQHREKSSELISSLPLLRLLARLALPLKNNDGLTRSQGISKRMRVEEHSLCFETRNAKYIGPIFGIQSSFTLLSKKWIYKKYLGFQQTYFRAPSVSFPCFCLSLPIFLDDDPSFIHMPVAAEGRRKGYKLSAWDDSTILLKWKQFVMSWAAYVSWVRE